MNGWIRLGETRRNAADLETEQRRVAHHESGHAVFAHLASRGLLGIVMDFSGISVMHVGGKACYQTWQEAMGLPDDTELPRAIAEEEIGIIMAGHLAECRATGKEPLWRDWPPSDWRAIGELISHITNTPAPFGDDDEPVHPAWGAMFTRLQEGTQEVLGDTRTWAAIEGLASALIAVECDRDWGEKRLAPEEAAALIEAQIGER